MSNTVKDLKGSDVDILAVSNVSTNSKEPPEHPLTRSGSLQKTPIVLSAGVLPYAYAPYSNNVYFLLGQEAFDPRWRTSERWCDFGGCFKKDETESHCAAREFVEESMAVVQTSENENKETRRLMDIGAVENMISAKQYTYRIALSVEHNKIGMPNEQKAQRVCYLKRVPWQPDAPEHFKTIYGHLKKLKELDTDLTHDQMVEYWEKLPEWIKYHPAISVSYRTGTGVNLQVDVLSINPEWMEKQQIGWWSLPRLRQVLRNGGRFKRHLFRYGFLPTMAVVIEKFINVEARISAEKEVFVVEANPRLQQVAVANALDNINGHQETVKLAIPGHSIEVAHIPHYFTQDTGKQKM
jgi:hypothetical protein